MTGDPAFLADKLEALLAGRRMPVRVVVLEDGRAVAGCVIPGGWAGAIEHATGAAHVELRPGHVNKTTTILFQGR